VRLYSDDNPLSAPDFETKVRLLEQIDAYARGLAEHLEMCERDGVDPLAGLTIADLRARDFGDGAIEIGPVYRRGGGYTTYRISYPADGLKLTGLLHVPNGDGPRDPDDSGGRGPEPEPLHLRRQGREGQRVDRENRKRSPA